MADVLPNQILEKSLLIKEGNHVYQLWTSKDQYFIKTYTKTWYQDKKLDDKGDIVKHEEYAFKLLAKKGLASPEVVAVGYDCKNQLGQPFLMTRKLKGEKITEILSRSNYQLPEFGQILMKAGHYLNQMHTITSPFFGYIETESGRENNPNSLEWQHRSWSAVARQKDALKTLDEYKNELSNNMIQQLKRRFEEMPEKLTDEYKVNHFIHGDCHPHQFFAYQEDGEWTISGFVDLEVSGFGDAVEDLLKFGIEMARDFPATSKWWQPFFDGYEKEPDFENFRLRLLATSPKELKWKGAQEAIRKGIMMANNWTELFEIK